MLPGLRAALPGLQRACVCAYSPLSHSRLRSSMSRPQSSVSRPQSHSSRLRSPVSRSRLESHSCTVEHGLGEEFVFVDCVVPEEDQDYELELTREMEDLVKTPVPDKTEEHRKRRGLEQQLKALKTLVQTQDPDLDPDQIEFHDSPPSLKPSRTRPDRAKPVRPKPGPESDPVLGFSSVPCVGCGALLHSMDPVIPGFLPPHHLRPLLEPEPEPEGQERAPEQTLCQRCHRLTHQQKLMEVQLDQENFRRIISSRLRLSQGLVLLVVDLVDLPSSIVPDLQDLIGTNKQVAVVGTKLDLLPVVTLSDLKEVKRRLRDYIHSLTRFQPVHVGLVSAKTGFGIEELVSDLHKVWRNKGDVVLLGTTNTGKSTLFNALLESDYNRLSGSKRATESPWPGTTLNLLKFPILTPTPARLQQRKLRLKEEAQAEQTEAENPTESAVPDRNWRKKGQSQPGYVSGKVGRTFGRTSSGPEEIDFDPDLLAFGETEDGLTKKPRSVKKMQEELPPHEAKDARWFYDTPGIIKEKDILSLLTEEEVRAVVPVKALVPRTFVLKPGSTLFVGGLLRIDFISGPQSVWFSVLVSGQVPLHLSSVEQADAVYEKHAGGQLLGVPMGGAERMRTFPKLSPVDVQVKGTSMTEAAADLNISSAGWVAVTPPPGDIIQLRVWSPEGGGVSVRTPSLLPRVVMLRGARIKKSSAYKPRKLPPKPLTFSSQSQARK